MILEKEIATMAATMAADFLNGSESNIEADVMAQRMTFLMRRVRDLCQSTASKITELDHPYRMWLVTQAEVYNRCIMETEDARR